MTTKGKGRMLSFLDKYIPKVGYISKDGAVQLEEYALEARLQSLEARILLLEAARQANHEPALRLYPTPQNTRQVINTCPSHPYEPCNCWQYNTGPYCRDTGF
jgi:hypothetical protein